MDDLVNVELFMIEDLITDAFEKCNSVSEALALWGAIQIPLDDAASDNIKRLGGDVDEARAILDKIFLIYRPEMDD